VARGLDRALRARAPRAHVHRDPRHVLPAYAPCLSHRSARTALTPGAEWSGINALLYYGPTLVQSIGLRADTVGLLVSGGIGVVMALAVVPAILCIDRLGACAAPCAVTRGDRRG
jgi:hypothetical protein